MQFPLNYNETLIKIIVRFLKLIISETTCMNVPVTKHIEGFNTFSSTTIAQLNIDICWNTFIGMNLKAKVLKTIVSLYAFHWKCFYFHLKCSITGNNWIPFDIINKPDGCSMN